MTSETENYTIVCTIRGQAWLRVKATSTEKAIEAGWSAYHSGEELQDVEWEVDKMECGRPDRPEKQPGDR